MKTTLNDPAALRALLPSNITAYLKSKKAEKKIDVNPYAAAWLYNGEEILVPRSTDIINYARTVYFLLEQVSSMENRDQQAVYRDMLNSGFDIIRLRNFNSNSDNGSFSFQDCMSFMLGAQDLLLATACSASSGKLYYPGKKPQEAEEFMRHVRFGRPEQGSLILTLLSPVSPALNSLPDVQEKEPYERTVIPFLETALCELNHAAEQALETETLIPFEEGASRGISANLCDAVVSLQEAAGNSTVDISITYASMRGSTAPKPAHMSMRRDFIPLFRDASRQIKEKEPMPDQNVRGPIIKTGRLPDANIGSITIQDLGTSKPMRNVTVFLQEPRYSEAVAAHARNDFIEFTGTITKNGRAWSLIDASEMRIIRREQEEQQSGMTNR